MRDIHCGTSCARNAIVFAFQSAMFNAFAMLVTTASAYNTCSPEANIAVERGGLLNGNSILILKTVLTLMAALMTL